MNEEVRLRLVGIAAAAVIIACVVALAIPRVGVQQRRQTSAEVVRDVEVLRKAVYGFYSDSAYFPPESVEGGVPDALLPYLPSSFAVVQPYGTLDYRNWPISASDSMPASNVIGVTVTPRDVRVAADAAWLARNAVWFRVGTTFTFVFFGA